MRESRICASLPKVSLSEEENEFDGKSLTKEQMLSLLEYYNTCPEPRRKEFLEMFFFAFHACGLRVVDVMTLQWKHIDFARKELRKIMIKTNKRHVIPLTEPALHILHRWQEKRAGCRYVFNLVKDDLDLDDAEALYKARNNATKCINQSLADEMYQSVAGGCRRTDRASVYPLNACGPAFVCGLCTEQWTFHVGCQSSART